MVTAAMKLKDAYSLEGKFDQLSIFKSRDITLPTKVCLVYGFFSSHVWMWELDYKESWDWRIDAFELCVGEDSWESLGLQGDPTSLSRFFFFLDDESGFYFLFFFNFIFKLYIIVLVYPKDQS